MAEFVSDRGELSRGQKRFCQTKGEKKMNRNTGVNLRKEYLSSIHQSEGSKRKLAKKSCKDEGGKGFNRKRGLLFNIATGEETTFCPGGPHPSTEKRCGSRKKGTKPKMEHEKENDFWAGRTPQHSLGRIQNPSPLR